MNSQQSHNRRSQAFSARKQSANQTKDGKSPGYKIILHIEKSVVQTQAKKFFVIFCVYGGETVPAETFDLSTRE